jgi:hypothetical protein
MVKFDRDGTKVWPYCSSCGCRLDMLSTNKINEIALVHFGMNPFKDARGCICPNRFDYKIVQSYKVQGFMNA